MGYIWCPIWTHVHIGHGGGVYKYKEGGASLLTTLC